MALLHVLLLAVLSLGCRPEDRRDRKEHDARMARIGALQTVLDADPCRTDLVGKLVGELAQDRNLSGSISMTREDYRERCARAQYKAAPADATVGP